jgi:hypothetical protein
VKSRTCWIFLALSLAGNLFFVGGYLYANKMVGTLQRSPEARMEQLAKRLQLDDATKQELIEARNSLAASGREFNRSRKELMNGFWSQLNDSSIERQQLETQLTQLGELELTHRLQVLEQVDGFLQQLNPEQQQRLLKLLDRRNLFNYLNNRSQQKPKRDG